MQKAIKIFIYSAGGILLITAVGKLMSSAGNAKVLQKSDPLLLVPYRYVFLTVGIIEMMIGLFCLFGTRRKLQLGLVAWLSTSFLIYRAGLIWIGYRSPCKCLGSLTESLHLSTDTADLIMKVFLAYLLAGSFAGLLWIWNKSKTSYRLEQDGNVPLSA